MVSAKLLKDSKKPESEDSCPQAKLHTKIKVSNNLTRSGIIEWWNEVIMASHFIPIIKEDVLVEASAIYSP